MTLTAELLTMSDRERQRLEVMQLLKIKHLSQKMASKRLGICVRQVQRLLKRYNEHGAKGLISGHRDKPSNNRLDPELKERALSLYQERYHDFGPTLACEYLEEEHDIVLSRESLRQALIAKQLWRARGEPEAKVHQQRDPRDCFGELVQIDGSPHDWLEGRGDLGKICLIVFIDDATKMILSARFEPTETTNAYFRAIKSHIENYGIPLSYYSDQHSIFKVNIKDAKSGTGETQVGRALRELGITHITANSPQAKGRVERCNKTLQNRLIKAMRLAGIASIEDANAFLPGFIEKYHRKFCIPPKCDANAHIESHLDSEALGHILSTQSIRTLSKNLECNYHGRVYQVQTQDRKYRLQRKKVLVCENPDGEVTIFRNKTVLPHCVFEPSNRPKDTVDDKCINHAVDEAARTRKGVKPAKNHPWKRFIINPRKAHYHRLKQKRATA